MGIDLGGLPPLTSGGATAGGMIAEFGRSIRGLAGTLGQRGRYTSTQQSFLDLQAAKEVIAAKDLYFTSVNEFNKQLDANLDYETQGEAWDKFNASTLEKIQGRLTLESAKVKFNEWYVGEKDKQADHVYGEIRKKTIASAQATSLLAIQNRAQAGDEQGLIDLGKELVNGGIYDGGQAMSLIKEQLPKARYNKVYREMEGLGDYDAALEELTAPGAADKFQLEPDQLKDMIANFDSRRKASEMAGQARLGKQQEALFGEFLQLAADETNFDQLGKEGLSKYMEGVSPEDREVVQRFSESLAATEPAKAAQERSQSVLYSRMSQQIKTWDGTGDSPWSLDTATQLMAKGLLTEAQRDKLEADWDSTQKDLSAGERSPAWMQQQRNASNQRSLMYGALEDLKDPMVAVTRKDVEDSFARGELSIQQRDSLLADRDRLHKDWIDRVEQEKKIKGPMREDPASVAELWRIVLDDKLSPTRKFELAKPLQFNGVPPETWQKVTAHIDELNNRPDWKLRMDSLNQFYNASVNALDKDDDERKQLALEKAAAGGAIMQLFRQYPDDPSKWDEGLRSLLDPRVKREVMKKVQERLQARFPGFLGIGGMSEAMQLETAAEQLGAEFIASPALVAGRALKAGDIAEQEERVLRDSGVRIVDRFQDEGGTWTYSTEPIPRDPTTGKPILDALRKAGKLYQVRSRGAEGKVIQSAGRVK
jgi:DNA-binding protein H-NS